MTLSTTSGEAATNLVTALRESERRFRAAFELSAAGMAILSPAGRWLQINAALCTMLGYSEAELLGLRFQEITHPDDLSLDLEYLEKQLSGELERFTLEKRYRHKAGHYLWVLLTVSNVRSAEGDVLYLLNQVVDISERKAAETALRRSEARYQAILDAVAEGVVLQDRDAKVVTSNAQAERIFGVTEEQMTPEGLSDTLVVTPEGEPVTPDSYPSRITLRTGEAQTKLVYGVTRPEGNKKWLQVNTAPIFSREGELDGVVTSFSDVTEVKRAQQLLEERAKELERSNRDLQDFAYVASHDLQEPLRMVSSYVELLRRRYGDALDQDAQEYIAFAVDGTKRMQRLIQDLLEYSRVGTREQQLAPCDAKAVCARSLKNLEVAVKESDAQIAVSDLPVVLADASQLTRLFQNLIGNAIKFSPDAPEVTVNAESDGDFWRFEVRDNGIGIPEADRARVFAIFQRLNARSEFPGTGVGLAICQRIVERHGGRIWAESDGEGSQFYFTLKKVPAGEKVDLPQ